MHTYMHIQPVKLMYRNGSILYSLFCSFFLTINLCCFFNGYRVSHHMDVPFVSTWGWLLGISWNSRSLSFSSYNLVPQNLGFPHARCRAAPTVHCQLILLDPVSQSAHPPKAKPFSCHRIYFPSFRVTGLTALILMKVTWVPLIIIWITDRSISFIFRKGEDC